MDNLLVLSKIASFLQYNDLKNCRRVNKLCNECMTREIRLKRKTEVLVNRWTLPEIMGLGSNHQIQWDSVRLHWSFKHSNSTLESKLEQFLEKYGKHFKALRWTGADVGHRNGTCRVDSPRLLSSFGKIGNPASTKLGQLITLMPHLEEFTFGEIESPFRTTYVCRVCIPIAGVLLHLEDEHVLTSLYFGSKSVLSVYDLQILDEMKLKLKHFTFTGVGNWSSSFTLGRLITSWSETLESLKASGIERCRIGRMPQLRKLSLTDYTANAGLHEAHAMPMDVQFPLLQELVLSPVPNPTVSNYSNVSIIAPPNIGPHINLKTLITSPTVRTSPRYLVRLLPNCPHLTTLITATVNDNMALIIFRYLRNLKYLSMISEISASTFTGLNDGVLANLSYNLAVEQQEEIVNANRFHISICRLSQLRELFIAGGRIDDASVVFGISYLKNLRKLTLRGSISDASLDRLSHHQNLIDLSIPAPSKLLTEIGINRLMANKPGLNISHTPALLYRMSGFDHFVSDVVTDAENTVGTGSNPYLGPISTISEDVGAEMAE